jgi:hypothetical protein
MLKNSFLIVVLLLPSAPLAVPQSVSSLPERDDIARIKIDHNPLHLYTTESLLETLPCFKPAAGGRAATPKLADRGLFELKNGEVIRWFAADFRSLVIRTRAGSQLFELSGECAYRRAGPAMRLHRYFFSKSDFPEPLPKRVERAVVERFLREILDWRYPEGMPLRQLRTVALFYDMQGIVPDLLGRLDARKTNGWELQRSILFAELVGLLGDDLQRETGRRYYRYLLTLPYKKGPVQEQFHLSALTNCLVAYMPGESNEGLLRRIERALDRLRPLARNDWTAETEMHVTEDLRGEVRFRVAAVATMKREIMQAADLAKRLDALVNIYLNIDQRLNEYVAHWALHKLVRAGRTGDAEQVIAAFRRAVTRLPREDRKDALLTRALHAVEFFGGKLTHAERAQMRTAQGRSDPLSFEETR